MTQDYAEAVRWYRQAAEQGHANAQNNLGIMYDNGEGVPEDDTEAVRWYRKAAEQRDADAQYNLGAMYSRGEGVTEDDIQAYAWISVASAQGVENAKKAKERLTGKMTRTEIAEAQKPFTQILGSLRSRPQYTIGFIRLSTGERAPNALPAIKMNFRDRGNGICSVLLLTGAG